jgi:hypothetical protein
LIFQFIFHSTFVLNNGASFYTGYEHVHLFVNNFHSSFKSHFMGLMQNGILGGFSGKVGTVVGGKWRGKEVMRSRPTRSKNAKKTAPQEAHQAKFTVATRFLMGMKELLELTFSHYAVGKTGANSALAHTLKNAITGTFPDYQLAYDKVLVSRGSLMTVFDGEAASNTKGTIQFSWTDNSGNGNAKADDQVLMVAYYPEYNSTIYRIGAARSAGIDSLTIPGLSGKVVHTWIAFISADRQDVATSIYSGEVTIV